jgi:RNA polymerase sigma-70 factor, ECF subfamily
MKIKDFDKEILNHIKNGNKPVFEILFKSYYDPLCKSILIFVKHQYLAEEIVQDTFLKLWEGKDNLNVETSWKSFLFRCVHNNCINYLKTNQIKQLHSEAIQNEIIYHAEIMMRNFSETALDIICSNELDDYLDHAIQELPEQCREIFTLNRFEQMSYQEIAQKLDISINTVKTQMVRALDKLRVAFNKF